MAHIYPERLPSSVTSDPGRAAECKVFDSLAQLSNQFTVFYSVAWQVRSSRAKSDGAAAEETGKKKPSQVRTHSVR